jgi:hypothetical protein
MKKIIIALLAIGTLGLATPALPVFAGSSVNVKVFEGSELQKQGKVSKASSSDKKKNTKTRLKRLKQLGINNPKSYLNYGKDLSLSEMGSIIAAWIIQNWTQTGQLPSALSNNLPNWLMLNINGTCLSGPCDRWQG